MPQRDSIHDIVKQALINNEWEITYDPYVISYGERFLFVDLGAKQAASVSEGLLLGAQRAGRKIAVEIKEFRGASPIADLEQAIGQYILYRLLLNKVDPERELFLAITNLAYDEIFSEPIGEVVVKDLPLQLLVVDIEKAEVQRWIPAQPTAIS